MLRLALAAILATFLAAPLAAGNFAVTATDSAWTEAAPQRPNPRRVYIQALNTNTGGVCASTTTAAGTTCGDSEPGVELSTGSVTPSIELFTSDAVNVRSRSGNQKVKGWEAWQ